MSMQNSIWITELGSLLEIFDFLSKVLTPVLYPMSSFILPSPSNIKKEIVISYHKDSYNLYDPQYVSSLKAMTLVYSFLNSHRIGLIIPIILEETAVQIL